MNLAFKSTIPKMAPIPVALCGKNPNMAGSFASHAAMGPEYYGKDPQSTRHNASPLTISSNARFPFDGRSRRRAASAFARRKHQAFIRPRDQCRFQSVSSTKSCHCWCWLFEGRTGCNAPYARLQGSTLVISFSIQNGRYRVWCTGWQRLHDLYNRTLQSDYEAERSRWRKGRRSET